ncbi:hypothetical protein [Paramicrobacterium humi]|uniref:hypothetical protein n=1 Tax=Paramicrobacterium humi TaxID=640635 RepID=UPI000AC9BC92|nr:hypothetical protein [Microbacterium humi]
MKSFTRDLCGTQCRSRAEFDISHVPREDSAAAVQYAVLGTALYEPVLLALRRLAHQDLAQRALGGGADA